MGNYHLSALLQSPKVKRLIQLRVDGPGARLIGASTFRHYAPGASNIPTFQETLFAT